jgi:hypothetical protein
MQHPAPAGNTEFLLEANLPHSRLLLLIHLIKGSRRVFLCLSLYAYDG